MVPADTKTWSEPKTPQSIEFDMNGPQEEQEDVTPQGWKQRLSHKSEEDRFSELLKIHQRMGHMPFAKLQMMAKQGILPKTLAKCPIPCAHHAHLQSKQGLLGGASQRKPLSQGKIIPQEKWCQWTRCWSHQHMVSSPR